MSINWSSLATGCNSLITINSLQISYKNNSIAYQHHPILANSLLQLFHLFYNGIQQNSYENPTTCRVPKINENVNGHKSFLNP